MNYRYIFILLFISGTVLTQEQSYYYAGFGSGLSSYFGGYFGKAYGLKINYISGPDYWNYDNDYYTNNNYSYSNSFYNYLWSPMEISFTAGYRQNDKLSYEIDASPILHMKGYIEPDYKSAWINNDVYELERNDYATMFALPVNFSIRYGSGIYIKAGVGLQYVSETYDRVRKISDYTNYYDGCDYEVLLYSKSQSKWLSGYTLGLGISYPVSKELDAVTEFRFTYFHNSPNHLTPMALDNAKEIMNFGLITKIFMKF